MHSNGIMTVWSTAPSVYSCPAAVTRCLPNKLIEIDHRQVSTKAQNLFDRYVTDYPTIPSWRSHRELPIHSELHNIDSENLKPTQSLSHRQVQRLSTGRITCKNSDLPARKVAESTLISPTKSRLNGAVGRLSLTNKPLRSPTSPISTGSYLHRDNSIISSNTTRSTCLMLPRISIESLKLTDPGYQRQTQCVLKNSYWNDPKVVIDGVQPEQTPKENIDGPITIHNSNLKMKSDHSSRTVNEHYLKTMLPQNPANAGSVSTSGLKKSQCDLIEPDWIRPYLQSRRYLDETAEDNLKSMEKFMCRRTVDTVLVTVFQLLYFYGTFFLGCALLIVAYCLHERD